jgi:hypothetical protein
VLETIRRHFCHHVAVLPEAASILFGGGFPRRPSMPARKAGQRAIFHTQLELERMVIEEGQAAVALCDRGTVDGLAYWPEGDGDLFAEMGTTLEAQLSRYAAVIHLRTPDALRGYNHRNPVRTESVEEALAVDGRIAAAWSAHPRLFAIDSADDFMLKLLQTLDLIRELIPPCCRGHAVPEVDLRRLQVPATRE